MKTILQIPFTITLSVIFHCAIGQTYTIPWAQQQPAWVFPLWFEDGEGRKDTAYMCYDPSGDNYTWESADTLMGEIFVPDDTSEFLISFSEINSNHNYYEIQALIESSLPSSELIIWKARFPLKITWDKALFYDPILLTIPVPNTLPDPLFLIKMFCNDNNPNYANCGINYPIFWIPEDNIGCCPDPYDMGIKTDSMVFYGDTNGPASVLTNSISIAFDNYTTWLNIEESEESPYQVFPNPVDDKLFINSPKEKPYTINIYSLYGQEVVGSESNIGNSEIELSHLDAGIYLLRLSFPSNSKSIKLIKR